MAVRGIYDDTELSVAAPSRIVEGGDPADWPGLHRAVRSEINMRPFERGRIGMAVSGGNSDAGRFFITLAPQPYLDGQKTCFGHVVSGMQIADKLSPGDRIRRITIKETVHYHDYQRY
jgi:peptidyl-prolyl cis-trans isomerase B (cyclophilin B)